MKRRQVTKSRPSIKEMEMQEYLDAKNAERDVLKDTTIDQMVADVMAVAAGMDFDSDFKQRYRIKMSEKHAEQEKIYMRRVEHDKKKQAEYRKKIKEFQKQYYDDTGVKLRYDIAQQMMVARSKN